MRKKFDLLDKQRYYMSSNKIIDEQQLNFIDMGNMYLEAYNRNRHSGMVERTICYISDYTREHFSTQEEIMRNNSYPNADKHIKHHQDYLRDVARGLKTLLQYKTTHDGSTFDTFCTIVGVLISDWFEFHIMREDLRFNEFIKFEVNKRD